MILIEHLPRPRARADVPRPPHAISIPHAYFSRAFARVFRTFLCALRYVVVHASFAGFFFCAASFLHLPFKYKNVEESCLVRRMP